MFFCRTRKLSESSSLVFAAKYIFKNILIFSVDDDDDEIGGSSAQTLLPTYEVLIAVSLLSVFPLLSPSLPLVSSVPPSLLLSLHLLSFPTNDLPIMPSDPSPPPPKHSKSKGKDVTTEEA
ncbi:hypothetical protein Fot_28878 [Forsythia ovata]|uniref:Uncharacterized protein n=1 Tax=Forsythia ovata TaxID=205694 RepID=A0ABD1TQC6_9LAMI